MKKQTILVISFIWLWSSPLFGEDLVDVYCQAVKCDPIFNGAIAELMSTRQDVPINRALLLPRVDLQAKLERQRIELSGINFRSFQSSGIFIPVDDSLTFYNSVANYYVKLSQPVFNYTSWAKLQQAKAIVRQGEATFCAATQDLIVRVVRAYFDILIADSNLFYTSQHKQAVAEQLRQSCEQFKVGVVPITNTYESSANYDLVVAQEINDRYILAQKIEALRAITNTLYCSIFGLSGYLPLITPEPMSIQAWVSATERQNYRLLAATFATLAARENIKVKSGDKLPVINTYGKYTYIYNSNLFGVGVSNQQKILAGGVELDWSPIQGGGITARTIQARFDYQKACQDEQLVHQEVISEVHNAYLGIFAGIAKVKADRASLRSSQKSLEATVQSYKVGTRTILDVLNQQTQYFEIQKHFAKDRYDYIYQTVLLKQAAGTLSVCDLQHINAWLYSRVDISKENANCCQQWLKDR